jgi:uncharacterized protein (TIGR02598 family)
MNTLPLKAQRVQIDPIGFSLVETVMALGIMGLAITALLGLIPQGIEMSRKAGHASAQARIMDTIATRLANMPWYVNPDVPAPLSAIDQQDNQRMLFDDQGVQVQRNSTASPAVYVARVLVHGSGPGPTLPGAANPQPLLRTVEVQIAATPNDKFDFEKANPRTYQSMPLMFGPTIP